VITGERGEEKKVVERHSKEAEAKEGKEDSRILNEEE
jgi:hypothetical protein